ncbi:hypothetical protein [Arthrobacter sp. ISL-5]|uniref:hypothetical protein n=1 Tax=Arthrobacter sp. ISL-5 TaxID=2819111 RepID=UPI001BE93FBD|nr:hypothetical protein [Arthrobacter sp. ISL-5]MBT2556007.1 hypothetical protein [Arthrobacter sp. ISL-5]
MFFWYFLLGAVLGSVFEAAGIVQPWRSLLAIAVLAAVFVSLIRGGVLEARQLRGEGNELPSYPVTRKSLISAAVITCVLWVIYGVAVSIGEPVFPLLPTRLHSLARLSGPAVENRTLTPGHAVHAG